MPARFAEPLSTAVPTCTYINSILPLQIVLRIHWDALRKALGPLSGTKNLVICKTETVKLYVALEPGNPTDSKREDFIIG